MAKKKEWQEGEMIATFNLKKIKNSNRFTIILR
jgi:hypothetical protein